MAPLYLQLLFYTTYVSAKVDWECPGWYYGCDNLTKTYESINNASARFV